MKNTPSRTQAARMTAALVDLFCRSLVTMTPTQGYSSPPIPQMKRRFGDASARFCYKNQCIVAWLEGLEWLTQWVKAKSGS
jgi:hypothetical protein